MSWTAETFSAEESELPVWESYYHRLAEGNRGVYHCPRYIKTLAGHLGGEAELFVLRDDQDFVYYPYFLRRLDKLPFAERCDVDLTKYYDIVSSWYYGGPLLECRTWGRRKEIASAFRTIFGDYCRDRGIVSEFIRFDPNVGNHEWLDGILSAKRVWETVYVDLSETLEHIWRGMETRCRTSIRKAIKNDIRVTVSDDEEDIKKFHSIYQQEMRRKGAPRHYDVSLEFLLNLFKALEGRAKLVSASKDGEFIGSSVCLYEKGGVAHDYLMATDPHYWKYQPNNLIIHKAIEWSKQARLRIYDLQGGRVGVYRFKKAFSKAVRSFYTASIVLDRKMYDHLKEKRGSGPGDERYFPEYRTAGEI